jgi:mannosyltransferase
MRHGGRIHLGDGNSPERLSGRDTSLFFVLAAVYIGLRAWDLTGSSLWLDEIFSLQTVREPWAEMFDAVIRDKVHPPLFYILLKLWVGIGGESLLWLKLFPFLLSVITIVPVFFLWLELRASSLVLHLTLIQLAPNPFLIYYAQELRMYSLLVLLTAVSSWMFIRYVNRTGSPLTMWILVASNLALVFTHYFGWLVVGTQAAFLLAFFRARARAYVAAASGTALISLPWFYLVGQAAARETVLFANIQWITKPTVGALWRLFCSLTGPLRYWAIDPARAIVFISPIVLWGAELRRRAASLPEKNVRRLFAALTLLPAAIVFVVSITGTQSFWYPRYLIIIFLPFMLLVAAAVSMITRTAVRRTFAAGVMIFAAMGAFTEHSEAGLTRVKWEPVAAEISAEKPIQGRINVYVFEPWSHWALRFYLGELRDEAHDVVMLEDPSQTNDAEMWLVYNLKHQLDRGGPPADRFIQLGYTINREAAYGQGNREIRLVRLSRGP